MAVLAGILPIVSRSSTLALELYRLAASEADSARDLVKIAKSINNLALIVKQVGTIIQEDDRLPSTEAIDALDDILDQCTAILSEVEIILPHSGERQPDTQDGEPSDRSRNVRLGPAVVARLHYVVAHLDSLRSTLAVMLQTLYTAQSVLWARFRPTISPSQGATAVANEKHQLETLIIEQQMAILSAFKLYEPSRPDARLLTEHDSSQSLVAVGHGPPKPSDLFKYQDKFIASLDTHHSDEEQWLPAVCGVSKSQADRLLDRWTRWRRFVEDAERKARVEKRETQQPFVESDSEDEIASLPNFAGGNARPVPGRPGTVQPLFTETASLPIPMHQNTPNVPPSPASSYSTSYGASPRSSGGNLSFGPGSIPVSPRTSITTLPVEAAAAVEAKDKDDDVDLEIPWTLYSRRHYWKYIDGKVEHSDTEVSTSEAFSDRHSWTEILASWVCKEAIEEAGYKYTQLRKERRDGRRTKFETCFRIERPLTFDQVHRLVERTVEMYRKTRAPSPPPRERPRRTSFNKRPAANVSSPSTYERDRDRDRTPIANGQPPLERSSSAYFPPPPPPLDRSNSMPGPVPIYPPNPRATNVHPPPPPSLNHPPAPLYNTPPIHYPPTSQPFDPKMQNLKPNAYSQSPLRQSFDTRQRSHRHDYASTSGTSDSDSVTRSRKHRSRSRRPSEGKYKRREHGTAKALAGVAGLTALLDGLVGI